MSFQSNIITTFIESNYTRNLPWILKDSLNFHYNRHVQPSFQFGSANVWRGIVGSNRPLPYQCYREWPLCGVRPTTAAGAKSWSTWWRHQMETFSALLAICVGIHRSPANSPHKGQWRGALMFSLICVWINGWVNNREAGDLRRYHAHYDVTLMASLGPFSS